MKPFFIKKAIEKNILDYSEVDSVLQQSQSENIRVIDAEGKKLHPTAENISNNSVLIDNVKNYKTEFNSLKEYFLLKTPELQDNIGWDVHVYSSPSHQQRSFKMHIDNAYNYIVQTYGKSRWILPHHFDVITEPGDVVFIPIHVAHECIPLSKRVSLSFPFWM